MNKIVLPSLLCASFLLVAPAASAQNCPPGSWLCADVSVNAGVQFGGPPPPPPQVVVVEQQPIYIPPPPPPPPRIIYVQQPQPAYTYTTTTTVSYLGSDRARGFGLGGFATGLGFGSHGGGGMFGAGGTLRYRQHPNFATELSVAGLAGTDYNSDTRFEVPVTLSELIYFNPQNRFQFYGVLGVGVSWAGITYSDANRAGHPGDGTASYIYAGGLAGLGAEWQLSPSFSIFGDVRGFVRTRVDSQAQTNPEFTRTNSSGRTESTNVSVGLIGQLGGIFYF